jgi:hypothetical protein
VLLPFPLNLPQSKQLAIFKSGLHGAISLVPMQIDEADTITLRIMDLLELE